MLKRVIFWFFSLIIFVLLVINVLGYILSAPTYSGPNSGHFNGKRFVNPDSVKAKGFTEVLKWAMNRDQGTWQAIDTIRQAAPPPASVPSGEVRVTFVNHATFLIQIGDLNILTDPIWSDRTSPVPFAGPKRYVPPGISMDDLPAIDAVIISHNHYDHLDVSTVKRIVKRFNPHFYAPLGVSQFLRNKGVQRSTDMDWWGTLPLAEGIDLHCVPAQHFSGRGTFDRDKTLWCGYVIDTPQGNIYFAGDTGYGDFFKQIGAKLGPFKIAMLPIGAYKPRWFMSPIHIDPAEAVKVHRDVHARTSIGMHFGTFPLADDGMDDPVEDLQKALEQSGLRPNEFLIMANGEHRLFHF